MSDLRVAVLGLGLMGSYHVDLLASAVAGAKVTVVNDFVASKADDVAGRIGARAVVDPIEAIHDSDVDAVLLATPGATHFEQVSACLAAGKPVLCEKPLTTDVETSYALVQQEAALGRQLIQVGFMRRFDNEYAGLRELIGSGGLGSPLMVHCTHRVHSVPEHFNSEFMIRDATVHEVDIVRFLLDTEIASIQVLHGAASRSAPEGASDPLLVVMETSSGQLVTDEVFVRTGVGYEVRTEVVGDRGIATIGLDQNMMIKSTDGRSSGKIAAGFAERFDQAYRVELQRWVDAARRGTIDGAGAWDGYAAVAVCEAGVQALTSGQRIPVQLAARP